MGSFLLTHFFAAVNLFYIDNSSVIRQKGKFQSGVSRKQSKPNFPKNEHFLPPDTHTRVYS